MMIEVPPPQAKENYLYLSSCSLFIYCVSKSDKDISLWSEKLLNMCIFMCVPMCICACIVGCLYIQMSTDLCINLTVSVYTRVYVAGGEWGHQGTKEQRTSGELHMGLLHIWTVLVVK